MTSPAPGLLLEQIPLNAPVLSAVIADSDIPAVVQAALEARAVELQPFFEAGRARVAEFMASVQRHILANQPLFERDHELERRARAARIPVPRRRPHEQLRDWSKVVWPDGTVGIPADLAGS